MEMEVYDAVYARQSHDVRDSLSIDMQIEKCTAKSEDPDRVKVYADRGFSGKNANRPDYERLMNDVEQGKIRKIIVYKLDRFSRSTLDFSLAWERMIRHHVDFVSVNESFDTSAPIGKAMTFIIMVFAQLERETIAERVTDNYYARAFTGAWMGGPAPFGTSISRIIIGGRSVPTLVPNEWMEYAVNIFKDYASARQPSLGSIGKALTEKGIADDKGSIRWPNVKIARLLRNPVYVKADADIYAYYKALGATIMHDITEFDGVHAAMLLGKRTGSCASGYASRQRNKISDCKLVLANWQGYVDSGTFLACQGRLQENRQIRNFKAEYSWLQGLMKCGFCGSGVKLQIQRSKSRKRYGEITHMRLACTGYIDHVCYHRIEFDAPEVEAVVEKEMIKVIDEMQEQQELQNQDIYEEEKKLPNNTKIEINKIDEKIQNLMNCIASGGATSQTIVYINQEIEKLSKEKIKLSQTMISTKKNIPLEKIDFKKLCFEDKKIVAKSYIKKVVINDNSIEISFRL